MTVLQNGETGEVLAMVAHRNEAALSGFFAEQGRRWCAGVAVVVSDGSKSYRAAIERHLGHATHVLDRFHVCRWFAARAGPAPCNGGSRADSVPPSSPSCSGPASPCCAGRTLCARPSTPASKSCSTVIPASPSAGALQELYGLYLADDRAGALAPLDRFCDLYATGEIPEFSDVVDAVIAWSTEILAFHEPRARRVSNRRLEGTNNKLQVLRRVAHGFVSRANFEARGILACPAVRPSATPGFSGRLPMNSRHLDMSQRAGRRSRTRGCR